MFSKILFIPKGDVDHAPSPDNPEKLDLPHFFLLSSVSEMALFSRGSRALRKKKEPKAKNTEWENKTAPKRHSLGCVLS